MQKIIKHKFAFIVSIALLVLPILGELIYSISQPMWDKLSVLFPMFILTYADSFPASLGIVFISIPIYILGIIGTAIYLFTKSKRTFLLKGMLFVYLTFFILITGISLCALTFQFPAKIALIDTFRFSLIIIWSIIVYHAAIRFDTKTNLTHLTD